VKHLIKFINTKGEVVYLPNDLTIEDLVKHGIEFKIEPEDAPLKDDWYKDQYEQTKNPAAS